MAALIVLYFLVPTWIRERPGSIHVAYVCCDADCQDAVHQGDEATVPLVTPGPIHVTQDEVERNPEQQAQERNNQKQCHLLFCRRNKTKNSSKHLAAPLNNSSSRQPNHITWWGNTAEEHILLCCIAYSRNRQLYSPKSRTVQSFVCDQQFAFASSIIAL